MTVAGKIEIPQDEIADFCRRWKITELALFGSVLREDFGPESDIDVLVQFAPDHRWSLFDHVEMEEELTAIFGQRTLLANQRAIEDSHNPFRKKRILESAEMVYPTAE